MVEREIRFFNNEFFKKRETWGARNNDPIFIVGLPRSGSTLIEQILASHSDVEGTMELPNDLSLSILLGIPLTTPQRLGFVSQCIPLT